MAKSTTDESSERKRISIPKADESVLTWWDAQNDPGLSVRLLIRGEIERSGYTDTAYRPVAQLPRRGRPQGGPGEFGEAGEAAPAATEPGTPEVAESQPAPVVSVVEPPAPEPTRELVSAGSPQSSDSGGPSLLDNLIFG